MTDRASAEAAPPVSLVVGIILVLGLGMVGAAAAEKIPVSLTGTLGFVTGMLCVYLGIRENVWNFPVGIANNVCFTVPVAGSKLYGDAALQVVYILLGVRGWYAWLSGGGTGPGLTVRSA